MNVESLATQVNLENQENLVNPANQENLAPKDGLAKMVLMETDITVPNVLMSMHTRVYLVIQEDQENVDLLDVKDHPDYLVMMPSAIPASMVKMANLVGPENLDMMAHLENLAMMVALVMTLA